MLPPSDAESRGRGRGRGGGILIAERAAHDHFATGRVEDLVTLRIAITPPLTLLLAMVRWGGGNQTITLDAAGTATDLSDFAQPMPPDVTVDLKTGPTSGVHDCCG